MCVFVHLSVKAVCVYVFLRYVIVECEDQDTQQRDPKTHEMYLNVMRRFSQALLKVSNLTCYRINGWIYYLANSNTEFTVFLTFLSSIIQTYSFVQGDKSVRVMRSLLAAQQTFVDRLVQLMKAVQRESGNRKKKVTEHQLTDLFILYRMFVYFYNKISFLVILLILVVGFNCCST